MAAWRAAVCSRPAATTAAPCPCSAATAAAVAATHTQAPAMAHHKPVIDQRAAEQMNLNVLKRIDPQIEEVRWQWRAAGVAHGSLWRLQVQVLLCWRRR